MLYTITFTKRFTAGTLAGLSVETSIGNCAETSVAAWKKIEQAGRVIKGSGSPFTVHDVKVRQ